MRNRAKDLRFFTVAPIVTRKTFSPIRGNLMKNRSVALLLETSNAYSRGLLDGIIGFVQQHRSWSVYLPEQERGADPPDWLRR